MFIDDETFFLDGPEWTDEEWTDRPRCNWRYEGYICHATVRWQILASFSDGRRTDTSYCDSHGIMFHFGVYRWSLIDHNTKAHTRIIDVETGGVCICAHSEPCDALERYQTKAAETARRNHV